MSHLEKKIIKTSQLSLCVHVFDGYHLYVRVCVNFSLLGSFCCVPKKCRLLFSSFRAQVTLRFFSSHFFCSSKKKETVDLSKTYPIMENWMVTPVSIFIINSNPKTS